MLILVKILCYGANNSMHVDYILAMATNNQLKLRASDIIEKAKTDYEIRLEPVTKMMETFFSPNEELEEVKKLVPESTWYRSLC